MTSYSFCFLASFYLLDLDYQSRLGRRLYKKLNNIATSENFYIYLSVITLITYSCIAGKYIILNVLNCFSIVFILLADNSKNHAKIIILVSSCHLKKYS